MCAPGSIEFTFGTVIRSVAEGLRFVYGAKADASDPYLRVLCVFVVKFGFCTLLCSSSQQRALPVELGWRVEIRVIQKCSKKSGFEDEDSLPDVAHALCCRPLEVGLASEARSTTRAMAKSGRRERGRKNPPENERFTWVVVQRLRLDQPLERPIPNAIAKQSPKKKFTTISQRNSIHRTVTCDSQIG